MRGTNIPLGGSPPALEPHGPVCPLAGSKQATDEEAWREKQERVETAGLACCKQGFDLRI
ncbi:MAG: hypothetical protein A2W25_03050 [candidate division Zixibacteria bacterium RBG_16_53_22]|nr:MAG: hypothetical protein A2W25_03050 [candidate division Zixibacteria bacterium RBG_16_53_22]